MQLQYLALAASAAAHDLPLETYLLMIGSWTVFPLIMVLLYVRGVKKGLWEDEEHE